MKSIKVDPKLEELYTINRFIQEIIQKEDFKRPISSLKKHYIDTRSSNDNSLSLSSKIDIESPNTLKILVYKNSFYEPIQPNQSNQSNFFQKYYKIFIIIGVIIVILCICIIMLFTIIFKTKDDKKINPQINVLQDTDKVIITNKSTLFQVIEGNFLF